MTRFITNVEPYHTVLLSTVGSGIFWLALQIVQFLAKRFFSIGGNVVETASRNARFREYIYRRFTSRDGLVPSFMGFQHTITKAFSKFLSGIMFVCLGLLFGSTSKTVWTICLVAAIVYLSSAWAWVTPSKSWKSGTVLQHWQRVAELEKELFGNIEGETAEFVAKFKQEEEQRKIKSSES